MRRMTTNTMLTLLIGIGSVYLGSAYAADKVTLCHFPPGNPANSHTITVGPEAAEAHIRNHGDVVGECCAVDSDCSGGYTCSAAGICLPVGQCPCWKDSNPIDVLEETLASSDADSCIDTVSFACDGGNITLEGQGSNGLGSISLMLLRPPDEVNCNNPSGEGTSCIDGSPFGIGSVPSFSLEKTTCIEEFEAVCAALPRPPAE